jgi:hypothetical protein
LRDERLTRLSVMPNIESQTLGRTALTRHSMALNSLELIMSFRVVDELVSRRYQGRNWNSHDLPCIDIDTELIDCGGASRFYSHPRQP